MNSSRIPSGACAHRIYFLVLVVLAAPIVVFSQSHPEIQKFASQAAAKIRKAGRFGGRSVRVDVYPFSLPDGSTNQFGMVLAQETVSAMLQAGKGELSVRLNPLGPRDPSSEVRDVLVAGTIENEEKDVRVSLGASFATDSRQVAEKSFKIRKTPEIAALLSMPVPSPARQSASSASEVSAAPPAGDIPRAGQKGISNPQCEYCPAPTFGDIRPPRHIQAMVRLRVVIDSDGRVSNLQVVQSPSDDFSARAIEAVRNWRFKPAMEPSGKPVATWVLIEVSFRTL